MAQFNQIFSLTAIPAAASLLVGCNEDSGIDYYKHPYWENLDQDKPGDDPVGATKVEVKGNKLYVNGEEFFIKGAALNSLNSADGVNPFIATAIEAGANCVRIYGTTDLGATADAVKAQLDMLSAKGVYVCFGIHIDHEADGFDYNDASKRNTQVMKAKAEIDKYKGHPAILFWCVGNECDQSDKNTVNANVWKDINEIAKYIKNVDGRPAATCLTGIWDGVNIIDDVKANCTDIDILCVNNYEGDVESLNRNWQNRNVGIPYIVSEFGIRGTWNGSVAKTTFGSLIEPSSAEKAESYRKIYTNNIVANASNGCIGSFCFLWGWQTHGAVLSWYSMYDMFEKQALPTAQVMQELWTGKKPENSAPVIASVNDLKVDNGRTASQSISMTPGSTGPTATVKATDPDGDAITYDWKIVKDVVSPWGTPKSDVVTGLFSGAMGESVSFKAPAEAGYYRLMVYARDKAHGTTALAVVPFEVK